MFLDLKEYGFEKFAYEISLDKITSVGGPFFVKHFAVNSGFSGAFASSINKLLAGDEANFKWNANYVPPHEKRMLGQVTVVFPHHFINIKCDGEHYQLAHANVGYKFNGEYFSEKDFDLIYQAPYRSNSLFGLVNEPRAYHGVKKIEGSEFKRRHIQWTITKMDTNPYPSALERVKNGITPEAQRVERRMQELLDKKI